MWGGYYEHGLIWRSRWTTDDGVVECREALALPAHPGRAVVLRRILAREGRARVRVALDLRGEFGAQRAKRRTLRDDGAWTCRIGDVRMTWVGAADARPASDGAGGRPLTMTIELEEGASHDLVLVLDAGGADEPPPDAGPSLERDRGGLDRAPPRAALARPRRATPVTPTRCSAG